MLKKVGRWSLVILVAFVLFHAVGQLRAPDLPDQAPDGRLELLDGTQIRLSELRGRPVILNFWARWCSPCRLEIPALRRFAERHPDTHLIGVTVDGSLTEIADSVEELGITWPVSRPNTTLLRAYSVDMYPTTVFIDAEGRVVASHAGLLTDPQLEWLAR